MALATGLLGQTTYAGNQSNQAGAASANTLSAPSGGLSVNAAGTFGYAADTGNNRILAYPLPLPTDTVSPTGTVKATAAASVILGQASPSTTAPGVGPNASSGATIGLAGPTKASVSDDGKLVVTDSQNNRVLIWNVAPTVSNTAPDVVVGQPDFTSNRSNQGAAAPSQSSLSNPTGAMLNNGYLVVVDQSNSRVLIWNEADLVAPDTSARPAGILAAVELGQDATTGTGFTTATSGYFNSTQQTVQFTTPTDVWTDGRSLVIADSGNNRVLYYPTVPLVNNTTATKVFGQPSGFSSTNPGLAQALLSNPTGVYVQSNNLFVADTGNNRVVEYQSITFLAQRGATASIVFGQEDFNHGTYNDSDQNGQAGDQTNGQSNTNGTVNTLHNPTGVTVDPNGTNTYVSDSSNNRIMQFPVSAGVDGTNTGAKGVSGSCNGYNPISPDGT